MSDSVLTPISVAIDAFRDGQFVIIVDDEDRENEGDLVIAAEHITPEAVNFMATHGRGLICQPMTGAMLDRLNIPMMVPDTQNSSGFGTGFTISVEAAEGVTTGISAEDRAQTIRTLINPKSRPTDIAMPGHMFPIRARDGGVLERRGQTEASVDLARLAGLAASGVICEIASTDGSMARLPELLEFAKEHNLCIISVDALAQYRRETESNGTAPGALSAPQPDASIARIGVSQMPTRFGTFDIQVYRDEQGREHSALTMGDISSGTPLTRVHSECLTGDAFGSLRCDCGEQLQTALEQISHNGLGILLYLRQEGRGIGLGNKIRAYALQDTGLDTVDANHQLGFPADGRDYSVAACMLDAMGVKGIRLMTNNPDKTKALKDSGINVTEQVPLIIEPQEHNHAYLQTKAIRMGHVLPDSADSASQ